MSKTNTAGFSDAQATWNRRFGEEGFLFGTQPNAWLKEQGGPWARGSRILCVADGEGRNSVWLAQQGHKVDAFDLSPVGVTKARALAKQAEVPVNYAVADCDALVWPQACYDGVAAIFVQFADPAMRQRLFANMLRCLKPGGLLILQGYTPRQLDYKTGGPSILSHLYTPELLRDAFKSLEIVEFREYEAQLTEGMGHHGQSALIGMVGRVPFAHKA